MAGRIILDLPNPALDSNGQVIANSTLTYYINGTTTPQSIYTDATLATPLANPLSSDAAGRFPEVWADESKSFSVKWTIPGAADVTFDNIIAAGVTGSNAGTFGVFETRAAAAASTIPNTINTIIVQNYATSGDGGTTTYRSVADTGTLLASQFRSNGATRRWQVYTGRLTPNMLGAKGDGATDDTAALQAACDIGGDVYLLPQTYNFTTLTITKPMRLIGAVQSNVSPRTLLNSTAATSTDKIVIGGQVDQLNGVRFEHLIFATPNSTGGAVMFFDNCGDCGGIDCEMFTLAATAGGIRLHQVNNFAWNGIRIVEPLSYGVKAYGDDTHRSDVITLDNFIVSGNSTTAGTHIPTGFERDGFVNTIGGKTWVLAAIGRGVWLHNTVGATLRAEFIEIYDFQCDFPKYEAVRSEYGDGIHFTDGYFHGSLTANNIFIDQGTTNTTDNISFIGGQCTSAALSGMYLNGRYQRVLGMEISTNGLGTPLSYSGIEIGPNSFSTLITGNHIGIRSGAASNTQKYGVHALSGADRYLVMGNDLVGNDQAAFWEEVPLGNSENIIAPNLGQATPLSWAANAPLTGDTFTVASTQALTLLPAGTIATFTLMLPANPFDGRRMKVFSTAQITAITVNPNGRTINNAPTQVLAKTGFELVYNKLDDTWYRVA